jgi:diguanylate cyclase (GGDEF)-like protein/PAS domain S-box-containing protein
MAPYSGVFVSDFNIAKDRFDPRIDALLRETENRLRRQNQVLVDLAKRPSIHAGVLNVALRDIAEAAAHTLDVDRVGIWFYAPDRQAIRCVDLYERSANRHTDGLELLAVDFPAYFRALESERTITAHDAQRDPRTSAFTDSYLRPHGIGSLVDAPFRHLGQMTGVVCHEHVGAPRYWTVEEESFASSLADLVTLAIDASERREAQELLRTRVELETVISTISAHFVNLAPDEVDEGIGHALEVIGRFVGADRCHVVLTSEDRTTATLTHEWCADGVPTRRNVMVNLPVSMFPWTDAQMLRMQNINITSLDELPPEAAAERRLHEMAGTRSLLAVPMVYKHTAFGFIGLHGVHQEMTFSEDHATLLKIVGEIFVGAIQRQRAERAIRTSEQRHRQLVERMREGLVQSDIDGTMRFVNDRFCEMTGYSRDELVGLKTSTLVATDEDRELLLSKAALRRQGISDQYEIRIRRRDGSVVWMEIGGAPVTDADGNVVGTIGVHNDITERRLSEEALRDSESRYRLMAENSTDVISRSDANGHILYASDATRRLLGYEPSEVVGRSIYSFVIEADRDEVSRASRALSDGATRSFAYHAIRKDGSIVWFETTSRAILDPVTGAVLDIVSVSRDISERKRAEEQIEYQAYHDALTGLPNRLLFRDRLTVALAHAKRLQQHVAVMFLDLDGFKLVNDTLGHSLGDELLKVVASRLRGALREEDSIARMGGDEFTVLLSDLSRPDDAAKIAQKLLDTIAQPIRVDEQELFVTTSIGIALFPNDGETAEALLKNADHAMYRAKDVGRNSYQLCTPAMNSRALERLSLENALRRAVERGEFVLHYQPQLNVVTGAVVGMEALMRWNHPTQGVVPPATFIPIAEETRLIVAMGEWALREACRQAKKWQLTEYPSLRMAVNLSPRQFQHGDLRKMIASALEESGLAPQSLELEITESTAMQNTDRTVATLRALRDMGVRIAIDDFGTGHSSLNYLRSFPLDSVKIDQAFIHEIESSPSDRAIVSAIIAMAHGLSLRVTAEGVETEEQLAFLRASGCEEVQGYLFGRPAPA